MTDAAAGDRRQRMGFTFRLKAKLVTPIDLAGPTSLILEGHRPIEAETLGQASPTGTWMKFKCKGFETAEEAMSRGRAFSEALLIHGVATRSGVDVGSERPGTFSSGQEFRDSMLRDYGKHVRSENNGLMVFEDESVTIIGMEARGTTLQSVTASLDVLNPLLNRPALSDRQRNAVILLNDSFFVANVEGAFILRVSSVEALCEQSPIDGVAELVSSIESWLAPQTASAAVKEIVVRQLRNVTRGSIRSAYMFKIRELLGNDDAKAFDRFYQRRSAFVHDGHGRGELADDSQAVLQIASRLLTADLRRGDNVAPRRKL